MTFAWTPKHWPTLDDFRAHLAHAKKPWWARGVVQHHTYRPLPEQWRGLPSMETLGHFYRVDKGWDAGPHLFLVVGAPNPDHDGIYQGTPLDTQGIHAGICNSTHFGVEIVGDFDLAPWSPQLAQLVYGVTVALLQWIDATEMGVKGHRECLPNKSCPGNAINMDAVRLEVKRRLVPVIDYEAAWGDTQPYRPDWGVPALWRSTYGQLGAAVSDEMRFEGMTGQQFAGGLVIWQPLELRGVYLKVKP